MTIIFNSNGRVTFAKPRNIKLSREATRLAEFNKPRRGTLHSCITNTIKGEHPPQSARLKEQAWNLGKRLILTFAVDVLGRDFSRQSFSNYKQHGKNHLDVRYRGSSPINAPISVTSENSSGNAGNENSHHNNASEAAKEIDIVRPRASICTIIL